MKDRINQIIRSKNLTATEFALKLGVQPSSVSHLLSGRNNPSLEFVKKLKETFPEYNLDWIIFGQGPVTVSEPFYSGNEKRPNEPDIEFASDDSPTLFDSLENSGMDTPKLPHRADLKQIVFVYDDNSFEVLSPK